MNSSVQTHTWTSKWTLIFYIFLSPYGSPWLIVYCTVKFSTFASKTRMYERKQMVMLGWWDFNGVKFSCSTPEAQVEYGRLSQTSEDWFIAVKRAARPVSSPAVQKRRSATSLHKSHPKQGAAVLKCGPHPTAHPGVTDPLHTHPKAPSSALMQTLINSQKFHNILQYNVVVMHDPLISPLGSAYKL